MNEVKIAELQKQEREIRNALSENLAEQRRLNTEAWCSKNHLNIGDEVTFMSGRKQLVGVLDHFEYSQQNISYPVVLLLKKDGTKGLREARVYYSEQQTLKKTTL